MKLKEKLLKLLNYVVGDPKHTSLEERLLNSVTFVNGIMNILGSVASFYLPNFLSLFLLNFSTGILFLIYYYLSRFKNKMNSLFWPFNITIFLFLSVNWFLNGGSYGGSHYYLIPALVIATMLLRKENFYLVYFMYMSGTAVLFSLEYFKADLVTMFPDKLSRFTDVTGNYLFVQFLTGLLIYILHRNLNLERKKSENLLLNILPEEIALELQKNDSVEPNFYESATVMFMDMAGFTRIAEKMTPHELIGELHEIFSNIDDIVKKNNLEKIKTIGDSYMAAGGLPRKNKTHAVDSVLTAMEICSFMKKLAETREKEGRPFWQIRLGIHTGNLVAGVVGKYKFAYDIWGDTVNTASRMESSGIAGEVNISEDTYELVKEFFDCKSRGKIPVKNKDDMEMFLVTRIKSELQNPLDPITPGNGFLKKYSYLSK